MAKLKTVLDSLEGIDDAVKPLYVKDDATGKFKLDADFEDVAGLKSALKKERDDKAALERRMKDLEGIDPDEVKRLRKAQEDAEKKKLEEAGQWKSLEQQLIEKHQKELGEVKQLVSRKDQLLEQNVVDRAAIEAIAAAKGSPALLKPHVKAHLKMVEEEGELVVRVVDEKGNVRIADAKGAPMTIAGLLEEMKASPDYARAFEASGSSGGGGNNGGGGGGGSKSIKEWTREEKAAFINKHGFDAWKAKVDEAYSV